MFPSHSSHSDRAAASLSWSSYRTTLQGAAAFLFFASAALAPAADAATSSSVSGRPITVTIKDAPVAVAPPPVLSNGSVLVPLRGVLEKLGAKVVYDAAEKRIDIQQGAHRISLHVGRTSAVVDMQLTPLPSPPQMIGGSAYVPLRSLAEIFGYHVEWDNGKQLVSISDEEVPRTFADHRAALEAAGPYGLSIDFQDATDSEVVKLLDAAKASGAGIIRFRFDWDTLQPLKNGPFNWAVYDRVVRGARQRNLIVTGILGDCAKWASVYNVYAKPDPKDQLYGAVKESELKSWETYVKRTVAHFGADVHAWQVWEAPSASRFRSIAKYYRQLTLLAAKAARQVDANVIIHAAEPGGVDLGFIDALNRSGVGAAVQGVSLYPRSQVQPGIPADIESFLLPAATMREQLAVTGQRDRDYWVGGLSWPVLELDASGQPARGQFNNVDDATRENLIKVFSPASQADYLLRAMTLALASGSEKVFWGQLRDTADYDVVQPINPEYGSGLLRRDFTPRPAFAAFQQVTKLLGNKPYAGALKLGPQSVVMVYDNKVQGHVVAWSLGGEAKLILNQTGVDPGVPDAVYIATRPDTQVLDAAGTVLAGPDGTVLLTDRPVWITNIGHETGDAARGHHNVSSLRLTALPAAYTATEGVKATFTEQGGEEGLFWRKYSSFRGVANKLVKIGDRSGLSSEVSRDIFHPEKAKSYIYLDVADDYLYFGRGVPVTVSVEVHRPAPSNTSSLGGGGSGFNIQYDSPDGYKYTKWQTLTPGEGWATFEIKIPDASFANRSGFDLMINTGGSKDDLVFGSVTVRRDVTTMPTQISAIPGN